MRNKRKTIKWGNITVLVITILSIALMVHDFTKLLQGGTFTTFGIVTFIINAMVLSVASESLINRFKGVR